MKCLFDSSILIAAFVQNHPKHKPAFQWLQKAKKRDIGFWVAAHLLLEIYHVLTSAPFNPKIPPKAAQRLIQSNIVGDAEIIALTPTDYQAVLEKASQSGHVGGIVYDMIVVQCAQIASADAILTLNAKDFQRFVNHDDSIQVIAM